jgi:acyl-CoA thioesterase-2
VTAGPSPYAQPLDQRLQLEPVGEDRFHAQLPGFGGVTLGCATLAAARTTELTLHSLHAYFLRPVPTDHPALLAVSRLRDGRRFASRRVEVRDGERVCCELVASFVAPGEGIEYQEHAVPPAPPAPEMLPCEEELAREAGLDLSRPGFLGGALEWRFASMPWRASETSLYQGWVRPRDPLPEERAFHAAALAFLADLHSHLSTARRLGTHFEPFTYTSLDQVLWVHRDEPWRDWRLLTTVSDVAHGGRAFTRRTLCARDGRLIATMAQEQVLPSAPARG